MLLMKTTPISTYFNILAQLPCYFSTLEAFMFLPSAFLTAITCIVYAVRLRSQGGPNSES